LCLEWNKTEKETRTKLTDSGQTKNNYLEQNPSTKANRRSAHEEIPRFWNNRKLHYRFHKRPPLIHILSQINPMQNPSTQFPLEPYNISIPSTPMSSE
jgi:hypothetical protein